MPDVPDGVMLPNAEIGGDVGKLRDVVHGASPPRAAGVGVIPVHAIRKTCATLLVAHDVHPRMAMQVFSHSQISVTMEIYSEVSSEAKRRALRRLGKRLDGKLVAVLCCCAASKKVGPRNGTGP